MYKILRSKLFHILSKRKLRIELLSSFIALQVVTVLSISLLMYHTQKDALLNTSKTLMMNKSNEKINSILERLNDINDAIVLGSHNIKDYKDISIGNISLVKYMAEYRKKYPFTESVFIALKNGVFMQMLTLQPKSMYRTIPNKYLPKNAVFSVRIVTLGEKKKTEDWYYIDSSFNIVEKESLPELEITLNFFTREWYLNAIETEGFNWSSIYLFSTTQLPGIAASYPIRDDKNKVIGAIGSDIHLKNLSQILHDKNFNGLSLIVNRAGEVIAHPSIKETAKALNQDVKLLNLEALPEKLAYNAFTQHSIAKNGQVIFSNNGTEYLSIMKDFDSELFKKWSFLIIAPTNMFISSVKAAQQKILIISTFILLIATFIISYLTLRIVRPINALVEQADHIRVFDLTAIPSPATSIVEIQKLQDSMTRMRRSLKIFGKFLPKNLVRMLIEKETDVKIGGRKKRLTLFFSDIEGFTTVCEESSPEKLMVHLSEYFDELSSIILEKQGTIDKFIGDAIMAFWGAPNADAKHSLHACEAALYCQKKLNDLNRKWIFEKKPAFNTRIGIHTGEVIIGNLGSSERMNYTVIGDNVNLASRLEGINKQYGTKIIISDTVLKDIEDHAIVRPLDIVSVKGKKQGVPIYELIAIKGSDPYLLPTNQELDMCFMFQKAFTHYYEQRFDAALEAFEQMSHRFPDDIPVKMYITRCQAFKLTPPGDDWDHIHHINSK